MSRGVRLALSASVLLACSVPGSVLAQSSWVGADVGVVGVAGSATISSNRITVTAEGTDIGGTADSYYFVYRALAANGQVTARVSSLSAVDPLTKGGLVIRQSMTASAIDASLVATASRGVYFQQRLTNGGRTIATTMTGAAPVWLRLIRSGSRVIAYRSTNGNAWTLIAGADLGLSGTVYVGLGVSSHKASTLARAQFDSVTYSTTIATPPAGPVAAFAFDEGAGTIVRDSVAASNATMSGGAAWTTGHFRYGLTVDGVNGTAAVPDSATIDLLGAATVEAWVMPSGSGLGSVAAKESATSVAYQLLASDELGRPAAVFNTSGGSVRLPAASALPLNAWSHVAATYDGATVKLFVNGAQVASASLKGSLRQTSGALWIGGHSLLSDWLNGTVDDLRVYNRALALTEIQTDRNIPVRTAPRLDPNPPTVTLTSPAAGPVSGSVTLAANAGDDVAVASVQFVVNGANVGSADTTAPYSVIWNTAALAPGTYVVTAVATDTSGNSSSSAGVSVTVADTTAPSVAITAPAGGSTVSGTVSIAASASDNVGVTSVQFLVNGSSLGTDAAAPYAASWSTAGLAAGSYQLTAVATDAAGNSTTSAVVTVTIASAVVVNARSVAFDSASHNAVDGSGQAIVTTYRLEIWTAGSNTSTGTPYRTSDMGKPASTSTAITIDQSAFFATLPKGQQFIATVSAVGPGGSARSGGSNGFTMQ